MKIAFDTICEATVKSDIFDYSKIIFKALLYDEINIDNSHNLSLFMDILISGGAKKILVDMENLEYISSSGIGILINTAKQLNDNSGTLVIMNVPHEIKHVLKIINLQNFIKIFDKENEALEFLYNY
ncbi:STAS domain-containing protein [Spirochaetota bacterium]